MVLQKDQFPITIQAFELTAGKELFIAEQVVNNQSDIDAFSAKYAGKIIKAKAVASTLHTTSGTTRTTTTNTNTYKRKSSSGTVLVVILLLIVILVAIGWYTGWIQRTFGINL